MVKKAISQMKADKALGPSGIVVEIRDLAVAIIRDGKVPYDWEQTGFKFNFFDSLLKLASGIIFYLLNLSANLLFHTYKHW